MPRTYSSKRKRSNRRTRIDPNLKSFTEREFKRFKFISPEPRVVNIKDQDIDTIMDDLRGERYGEASYCNCQDASKKDDMIACDNLDCTLKWFHIKCIGLRKVPQVAWFCETCRVAPEKSYWPKSTCKRLHVTAKPHMRAFVKDDYSDSDDSDDDDEPPKKPANNNNRPSTSTSARSTPSTSQSTSTTSTSSSSSSSSAPTKKSTRKSKK